MALTLRNSSAGYNYSRCDHSFRGEIAGTHHRDTAPPPDDKPERVSLVELKNGKLVVKQKPLSFEKMSETMQGASRSRIFSSDATFPDFMLTTRFQRSYNSVKSLKSE